MGVYCIHPDVCPSVCPSVRPSVDKVAGTFWKNYWLNSFHTWHYPYVVSLLTPIHFRVPRLIFGPLVAKYLAGNGVSGTFWKNYWLNSFHTWHLPLWGEFYWPLYIFVFLASFLAFWWPNVWLKMWFPELFEKLLAQFISYLAFILMGWVSWPLTPVHFRVPSLIFGPLVAKYLAENGVSGTFWRNYWLNSFYTWHLSLWGESLF